MILLLHMHNCSSEHLNFEARSLTGHVFFRLLQSLESPQAKTKNPMKNEYLNNEYLRQMSFCALMSK
jgi:hypothetical protein